MARVRACFVASVAEDEMKPTPHWLHWAISQSTEKGIAHVGSLHIRLTKREFELLLLFASRPRHVFSRDDLLNLIWGYDYFGDNRTVDSHIKRLRAKLNDADLQGWQIETVWGVGYKMSNQAETES